MVSIVYIVFAVLVVLVLFLLITWAVVTTYRLIYREAPTSDVSTPRMIRQRAATHGAQVVVGVRKIREEQRHYQAEHPPVPYVYDVGESDGIPSIWIEDLWRRRN